jgi:hypothetical protein
MKKVCSQSHYDSVIGRGSVRRLVGSVKEIVAALRT